MNETVFHKQVISYEMWSASAASASCVVGGAGRPSGAWVSQGRIDLVASGVSQSGESHRAPRRPGNDTWATQCCQTYNATLQSL